MGKFSVDRRAFAALSTAMLIGAPASAQAAQIVQTASFFTSASFEQYGLSTSQLSGSLAAADTAAINLFDPTLGTLDSVAIQVSGEFGSYVLGRFEDPDTLVFSSKTSGLARVTGGGVTVAMPGFLQTSSFPSITGTCSRTETAPVPFVPILGAAAACLATESGSGTFAPLNTTLTGGALAGYLGVGALGVSILQNGGAFAQETNGDNGYLKEIRGELAAQGTLRVTYNYTAAPPPAAVPEPASWALMIAGFGMAGGVLRLRRRAAAREAGQA